VFLPDLANSLNTQSIALGALGRQEDALAAINDAVRIRRDLAAANPDIPQIELEQSLHVLAWLEGEDMQE
jgi:hypothetical protein